ncbi:MAG: hypothetical protein AAGA93_19855 [Actinomycetota bacterium]
MHADLQRLLSDDLLADLSNRPMDELRSIRDELTRAEGDISLVRRIAQGRLDIVGREVGRRSDGASSEPSTEDPTELLFAMPDILADGDGAARSAGAARLTPVDEPGPVALASIESLDGVASPNELSGVGDLDGADLAALFDRLRSFEIELSAVRRTLHERIDGLQDEIARRYRDGEASVDALLRER